MVRVRGGGLSGSAIGAGAQCAFASYEIPNGVVVGDDILVNKPKSSAYRAPEQPRRASGLSVS